MAGRFRLKGGDSLVVATHNQGKLREFCDLFGSLGVAVASSGELGVARPSHTAPGALPQTLGVEAMRSPKSRCSRFRL